MHLYVALCTFCIQILLYLCMTLWLCFLIVAEVYSTHYRWEGHTGEEVLSHSYKCPVHTHSGVLGTPNYWVCISHQMRCTYRGKRFTPYLVCNSHFIYYSVWMLEEVSLHSYITCSKKKTRTVHGLGYVNLTWVGFVTHTTSLMTVLSLHNVPPPYT